ncbi:hypothetical protein THIOM_001591 [Candidatus Thiomargarita nelsonii]|uniref:Uncharacterized protein n=1 Tax=Candidatus Thiomargarita nelsonii TaxID=1003181 RepID=A0A176S3T0_9GAMM|nr:hypothetical protein THIOM_001591 [Candidatus Thiomargarita nelsonii]
MSRQSLKGLTVFPYLGCFIVRGGDYKGSVGTECGMIYASFMSIEYFKEFATFPKAGVLISRCCGDDLAAIVIESG